MHDSDTDKSGRSHKWGLQDAEAPKSIRVGNANTSEEPAMAMDASSDHEALLTPSEVAAMFRVNPKTVTRWARAGKISAIRTLGGHRRFRESEIRRFLEQVEEGSEL
jgi:excisionase family DNA binding protein